MTNIVLQALQRKAGLSLALAEIAKLMATPQGISPNLAKMEQARRELDDLIANEVLTTTVVTRMVEVSGHRVYLPYSDEEGARGYVHRIYRKPGETGAWHQVSDPLQYAGCRVEPCREAQTHREATAHDLAACLLALGDALSEYRTPALTAWLDSHAAVAAPAVQVQSAPASVIDDEDQPITRSALKAGYVFYDTTSRKNLDFKNTMQDLRDNHGLRSGDMSRYLVKDIRAALAKKSKFIALMKVDDPFGQDGAGRGVSRPVASVFLQGGRDD